MASLVYKGSPSSLSLVAGIKQDERATPPPPPPAHSAPPPHQTLPPQPPLLSSLPPNLPHLKQEAQEYHLTAADMHMVSRLYLLSIMVEDVRYETIEETVYVPVFYHLVNNLW